MTQRRISSNTGRCTGKGRYNMNPLLLLNSILLIFADVVFALLVSKNLDVRSRIRKMLPTSDRSVGVQRLTGAIAARRDPGSVMNLFERLELKYIEKSNIRHYLPFMNIYILAALSVILFCIAYRPVYGLLRFVPSSAVISGIIAMTPFFALDMLTRYNSEIVRKRLSEYISVLNRWCSVKEDIMYAFEKSLGSNVGEPLQTFIRDMVIQVNRGMESADALDMLQRKVDNPQFKDFIINIKLSLQHRGDIIKLLTNLETQFYRIDEEYNRRSISTYKDRLLIYLIMFGVLAVAYCFINFSPKVGDFYLRSTQGRLLLMLFSGMYALGLYLTAGITKFKH